MRQSLKILTLLLTLTACGKAPSSNSTAPELMSTMSCTLSFAFPDEANAKVPLQFQQNIYADGTVKNTCIPKFPGMYMDIDCATGQTVNFTYGNVIVQNGQLVPIQMQASITANPNLCTTTYGTAPAPASSSSTMKSAESESLE